MKRLQKVFDKLDKIVRQNCDQVVHEFGPGKLDVKLDTFGGIAQAIWVLLRCLKLKFRYYLGFSKKISDEHTSPEKHPRCPSTLVLTAGNRLAGMYFRSRKDSKNQTTIGLLFQRTYSCKYCQTRSFTMLKNSQTSLLLTLTVCRCKNQVAAVGNLVQTSDCLAVMRKLRFFNMANRKKEKWIKTFPTNLQGKS